MNWMTDEMLFYGGLIIAGCSLGAAILYFCVSQIGMIRLKTQLDAEYGEKRNDR